MKSTKRVSFADPIARELKAPKPQIQDDSIMFIKGPAIDRVAVELPPAVQEGPVEEVEHITTDGQGGPATVMVSTEEVENIIASIEGLDQQAAIVQQPIPVLELQLGMVINRILVRPPHTSIHEISISKVATESVAHLEDNILDTKTTL